MMVYGSEAFALRRGARGCITVVIVHRVYYAPLGDGHTLVALVVVVVVSQPASRTQPAAAGSHSADPHPAAFIL